MPRRVLIVSPDERSNALLERGLERKGFALVPHLSAGPALSRLTDGDIDAAMVDLALADPDGIALCQQLSTEHPQLPVLAIAPSGTLESAVGSFRSGAYDYLTRPLRIDAVAIALERAVQHRSLKREVERLRLAVDEAQNFGSLLGQSPPMRELYELLDRIASSDVSVLITGETGTGKELVARELHARSRRSQGAFVAVNCAAVPDALLESELFGHVKGAFTDARTARPGLFVRARGGTIFLDEIGDMPLSLQPKLLRALQDRRVRPVGSDTEQPFDARVVAATNRDLETAVAEERFRRDLYFRVNVIQVDLPPLRSRGGDVLLLAERFLDLASARAGKDVTRLGKAAAQALTDYTWPGNVRELENCIERAVALSRGDEVQVEDLPTRVREHRPSTVLVSSHDPTEAATMDQVEERYIRRVMVAVNGNKSKAARVLGFDRKTLYRKLNRYGIDKGGSSDAG